MSPMPLVYVHGAGPQASAAVFKREADGLIFGKDMPSTRVGYYANVRWPAATGGGTAAAPARTNRARRVRAIRSTMAPELSADAAAAQIVAATLTAPPPGGRRATAATARPTADDIAEATRLVEELYLEADRIANRSPRPRGRGTALNLTFPDPIFRFVVGKFASDVVDYLYGPFKAAMREPVRQALKASPAPKVVVAHSLGTIITYDVLSEPDLAELTIDLLVTVGCPLGIGNVQRLIRDRAGRPNPVPPSLAAWSNFSDPFDPVALEQTLHDEFDPPKNFAHDEQVNNQARNNHDLAGYLKIPVVSRAIATAAG